MREIAKHEVEKNKLKELYENLLAESRTKSREITELTCKLKELDHQYKKTLRKKTELLHANLTKQNEKIENLETTNKNFERELKEEKYKAEENRKKYQQKVSENENLKRSADYYQKKSHETVGKHNDLIIKLGELREQNEKL
jgi:hypothetical protein